MAGDQIKRLVSVAVAPKGNVSPYATSIYTAPSGTYTTIRQIIVTGNLNNTVYDSVGNTSTTMASNATYAMGNMWLNPNGTTFSGNTLPLGGQPPILRLLWQNTLFGAIAPGGWPALISISYFFVLNPGDSIYVDTAYTQTSTATSWNSSGNYATFHVFGVESS